MGDELSFDYRREKAPKENIQVYIQLYICVYNDLP